MIDLYPLLMTPMFDPRPWGATNLSPVYPSIHFEEKIGEAWLTGDNCKVANGPLRGRRLGEMSVEFGQTLAGTAAADPHRFPLLTKFLFPHEKLSVQVHPDDEVARAAGHPHGKTECWYVAHASPGAQVALGLKTGVTREQFRKAIAQNRAEELLRWINVYSGEMIYVAGGTVHTLGPGSIIVETQQQSDVTYRLYDYGRPRELHLDAGMAAVKEEIPSGKVIRPAPVALEGTRNRRAALITAPYFAVDLFELKELHELRTTDGAGASSAQIIVVVEGCAIVEARGTDPVTVAKGDAVVVPACLGDFRIRPLWTVELLKASVPRGPLPEPATRM